MSGDRALCRSCGASILWAVSAKTGKRMPLDGEPTATGTMAFNPQGHAEYVDPKGDDPRPRFLSHHASCPQGASWKRGAGKGTT